jgi:sugar/nucleoside kinase (ribokinase family)
MSLFVNGSVGIDTVYTPTGSAEEVLGGSGIYFAAAASFFGPVRFVGAVGEDFPDQMFEEFKHFKVDIAGLEKRAGSKTFRWTGKYLQNMNDRETLKVELNVLIEKMPPVPAAYQDSKYLFLATNAPQNQLELLDQFPQRKLAVADTIDLYIKEEKDALTEVVKRIDGLVINDSEAQLFAEVGDLNKAADKILELGPSFIVIKKGEHGALLRHKDGVGTVPAYPEAKVVDPTGAGDSFAGGMMGYLAATDDVSLPNLRKAMGYGTTVASYNIESFTVGRLKEIGKSDINSRYQAFAQMLSLA